jgi:hypothetical protein
LQIHTDITADRLANCTGQLTFAILADLAVFTGITAGSTVCAVGFGIDATAATIG